MCFMARQAIESISPNPHKSELDHLDQCLDDSTGVETSHTIYLQIETVDQETLTLHMTPVLICVGTCPSLIDMGDFEPKDGDVPSDG